MGMRILAIAFAAVAITGCTHNDGPSGDPAGKPTKTEAIDGDTTRPSHGRSDPCSLLEPREVEAVIGPLAGPPFRTRDGLEPIEAVTDGDTCVYETPDFRAILLGVTWKDGAMALKALTLPGRLLSGVEPPSHVPEAAPAPKAARTLLPGGVQIDGEWDEASSFGCCQIFALRGDQLVTFDYRAWRADTTQAVRILNRALVRLEHPLAVDGNAGNEAASKRTALRPKPRPACSLLARADVEAILGPLAADPRPDGKDDTAGCIYRFTQAEGKGSLLADAPKEFKSIVGALTGGRTGAVAGLVDTGIQIRWRGGFRAVSDSELVGGAVGANFAGQPGLPKRTQGRIAGGPWDEAAQTSLTFTGVKNDVALTIDTAPMLTAEQVELRQRLVAKAVEALAVK